MTVTRDQVIEALLCTAGNPLMILSDFSKWGSALHSAANDARCAILNDITTALTYDEMGRNYDEECIEAAYRLIETSPKLRREWFGR